MIYFLDNTNLLIWFETQTGVCGIIQSCNCFHTQGAGIAKQIRDRYPEAYDADRKTKYGDKGKLGTFSVATIKNDPLKLVYNLYGQHEYGRTGRHTSYDAVVNGLEKIKIHAIANGLTRVGMPKWMGCCLGGGSWRVVWSIVQDVFEKEDSLDLFVCNYDP